MNKKHFLALIATLFITLGTFAQTGNTYSMVLTLADGTVITIGPNDLTKLDFKEGNITATGTSITDLMDQMKAMKASIDKMEAMVYASQDQIAALNAKVDISQTNIETLAASVAKSQNDIAALATSVAKSQTQIDGLQDDMEVMQKTVDDKIAAAIVALQKTIEDTKELLELEIAENKEVITNEYTEAIDEAIEINRAEQQAAIEAVQAEIDQNTADINKNKANITTNAIGIETNKEAIKTLIKNLRDAGIRI